MNTFNYSNITVDTSSFEYSMQQAGQKEGGIAYNATSKALTVYTDLDQVATNSVVSSHDPDSLFAHKVAKVEEFERNTYVLSGNGVVYNGYVMGVSSSDKALYTSIASDDDNTGVSIVYPLQLPASQGALVVVDRSELDGLITAVNDRLIYLWESQQNGDGSYGLVGYSSQIFQAADMTALDAIVDTRS